MAKTGTRSKRLQGAKLCNETNFSAFNNDLPLWNETTNMPFKPGDRFPDIDMQERADINLTMNKLVSNDIDEILHEYIIDWPIKNPITGRKIKQIAAELPIFSTVMKTWSQLLSSCFTGIEVNGVERPDLYETLSIAIDDIIKNKFTCCDRASICYKNDAGRPVIHIYSDKNIVLHRTKADERIVTITNVEYFDNGVCQLEAISYLPNKSVYRTVYNYSDRKIGKVITGPDLLDAMNNATYSMNGTATGDYGMPELYDCFTAAKLAIRAFVIYATLLEWKKNVTFVAPGSSIIKDIYSGVASLTTGSSISYDDKNSEVMEHNHDVSYISPKLDLDEAERAVLFSLKQVSLYSQLSDILLGYRKLSGNDSGRAILADCITTISAAKGYIKDLAGEIKELAVKLCELDNEDITASEVKIQTIKPEDVLLNIVNGLGVEPDERDASEARSIETI